jgi:DNA modification methylase
MLPDATGPLYPVEVKRSDCFEACADLRDVDLVIADPPYGGIVNEEWDKRWTLGDYARLTDLIKGMLKPNGTAYVWGGIGTPANRLFFEWLGELERRDRTMKIHTLITWKKKRGYGTANNYLFTREECAMLVKCTSQSNKPAVFNIPLLEEKRGYAGYNAKYPAKSEFLRVTNVWTDINEIFRGKIHPTEKPSKLARRMIATSSNPHDLVVDPMAGSGSTGVAARELQRRCLLVEQSDCAMRPLDGSADPSPPVTYEEARETFVVRSPGRDDAEVTLATDAVGAKESVRVELRSAFRRLWQTDAVSVYTAAELNTKESR